MYENFRLDDSMGTNISVSTSRNLSIGVSKCECESEFRLEPCTITYVGDGYL